SVEGARMPTMLAALVTSATNGSTFTPVSASSSRLRSSSLSARRATGMMFAPCSRARIPAMARPSPEDAPVTSTHLPRKSIDFMYPAFEHKTRRRATSGGWFVGFAPKGTRRKGNPTSRVSVSERRADGLQLQLELLFAALLGAKYEHFADVPGRAHRDLVILV